MKTRNLSPLRTDPSSDIFDPVLGAIINHQQGHLDEAGWLVFLCVHFGKHRTHKWRSVKDVYGRLGTGNPWDWSTVSQNPQAFRTWLNANRTHVTSAFGTHRSYTSLDANSSTGTGAAVETYAHWVGAAGSHQGLFQNAIQSVGPNPNDLFDFLFQSMNAVRSFGRLAKFDYLAMLGKVGLANVSPRIPYLVGATGPQAGARLLLGGGLSNPEMNELLSQLGGYLNLNFGMQIMEDALCNWQKSPNQFVPFRG